MSPIECLREVREATAAEIADRTGWPLEDVYEVLVRTLGLGRVSLRQTFRRGKKPLFTWVAM